jgi:hypothetical protein
MSETMLAADAASRCDLFYFLGSIRLAHFPMDVADPLADGPIALVRQLHAELPNQHKSETIKGHQTPIDNFIGMSVITRRKNAEHIVSFPFVLNPEHIIEIEPFDMDDPGLKSHKGVSALRRPGEKVGMPGRLVHLPLNESIRNRFLFADRAVQATALNSITVLPHVLLHRRNTPSGARYVERILSFDELKA